MRHLDVCTISKAIKVSMAVILNTHLTSLGSIQLVGAQQRIRRDAECQKVLQSGWLQ